MLCNEQYDINIPRILLLVTIRAGGLDIIFDNIIR